MPRRRKSVVCSNCQYRFDGVDNYCPNCGQENHSHHAPIKHLAIELVEGLTHFDTKFISSTKALFLRPGQLTKDYIHDKRARYVPPIRMYIFISFIFFFCLTLASQSSDTEGPPTPRAARTADATEGINFSLGSEGVSLGNPRVAQEYAKFFEGAPKITSKLIDSVIESKEPDISWFKKIMLRQNIKAHFGLITSEKVFHTFFKNMGIALFILMPLFAVFLKISTRKHHRLYIEHLIFSIHFHSFILAILSVSVLLSSIVEDSIWTLIPLLWIPVYGVLAMKKVYERPWTSTIVKSVLVTCIYSCVVLAGLLLVLIISTILV